MTRSPRELATQKIQLRKQQEKLLTDLLTVVDDLDSAVAHWQQAERHQSSAPLPLPWWQRWRHWLRSLAAVGIDDAQADNLSEIVTSARAGTDMIRESMLTVLSQHQVTPFPAEGHPFDPTHMHALGQQATTEVPPNTVVQEVVRGYRWKDRILRAAQVIVAVAPAKDR
ncbi:MAG: nucleotide exchange factor GrpE [Phormidesmis sp.]